MTTTTDFSRKYSTDGGYVLKEKVNVWAEALKGVLVFGFVLPLLIVLFVAYGS